MIELRRQNVEQRANRAAADNDRAVKADLSAGEDFVRYAMDRLNVPDSEREGVWIGGLALPFGETYVPEGLGWGERFSVDAFDETLAEAREGSRSISLCSSHDCNVATGLIGRTAADGEMSVRYWVEKESVNGMEPGLYVIGRVAEFAGSTGVKVAEQIARDGVEGISIGFRVRDESPAEVVDGVQIYEVLRARLFESSPVDHPAYERTWAAAGEARPGDHGDKDRDGDADLEIRCAGNAEVVKLSELMETIETRVAAIEQRHESDLIAVRTEVLAVPV